MANERVPFYRRRFREVGFEPGDLKSLDDLKRLPILTKKDLKQHFADRQTMQLKPTYVDVNLTSAWQRVTLGPITHMFGDTHVAVVCANTDPNDCPESGFWVDDLQVRPVLQVNTNPHSPGRYRVNGVLSNMPEFAKAFSCKADAPMGRQNACRVW